MTIRLNGQTSGYVELEAPATAGSNTLVLPTNNGTSGQYLQTNGSGALSWQTVSGTSVAVIVDQKGDTTYGGTFTSGAWQTRDLNTKISDPDGIVTLSSNQFTLGAGTYLIHFTAPAYNVDGHQTRLYDVTNTSVVEYGTSEYTHSSYRVGNSSMGAAVVTITANTTYRIEHRAESTWGINGFGNAFAAASGDTSRYARAIIYKVA
jgi:hypothetical protein